MTSPKEPRPDVDRAVVERLRRDLEMQDGGGMAYSAADAGLYVVSVQGEDLRAILAALPESGGKLEG